MNVQLNPENYFSPEALTHYFSVSQYKDFVGTKGQKGCEAQALAKMRGEWFQEETTPLLVGSYVDAYFDNSLEIFKNSHPQLFKKDGNLLAAFEHANTIIKRIESDQYFMKFLSGVKQQIFTGEIFGVPWKVKVDSILKDIYITDLKVMRAIRDSFWTKDMGYMSFVEYWGYDIQGCIYQEIVRQNIGQKLPFFIAAATKENYPDIEIIGFIQNDLDNAISTMAPYIERIKKLKSGEDQPDRCENCDYCKSTKVLTKPIHFSELILGI